VTPAPRGRRGGSATDRPRRRALSRPHGIALTFSVFLALFGVRLFDLQINRYHEFATQSDSNFQRDEIIRALRGEIRTRDGVLVATNRMAIDLIYKGGDVAAWPQIRYHAGIEDVTPPDVPPGGEVTLARNIAPDRIPAIQEYTVLQPNLELRERLERVYPQGKFMAHTLGYTRESNEREVEEQGSALGDLVGASGLEASLQAELSGKNGIRRLEVTAEGRPQS